MYMNQGGIIGYRYGRTYKDATEREKLKEILKNRDIISLDDYSTEELMSLLKGIRPSRKQGRFGRLRKQEGGGADYINTHLEYLKKWASKEFDYNAIVKSIHCIKKNQDSGV